MAKFTIDQFTGGITDYIYKADKKFSEILNNLFIDKDFGARQRPGSKLNSEDYPRITTNDRIDTMVELNSGDFLIKTLNKIYLLDNTGFTEVQGQGSRSLIYSHADEEHIDTAKINNKCVITSTELNFEPLQLSKDINYEGVTAGLPEYNSDPVVAPPAVGSNFNYVYAFVRYRTYTSMGLTVEDFSTPTFVELASNVAIDGSNTASVTNIIGYTNAANEFYSTGTGADDMKTRIYRTVNNGNVLFYIGDSAGLVDNGTTTATDNVTDATITGNVILYTQGYDKPFNDSPPLVKYCTEAKDAIFYAHSDTFPTRVWQSKILQPGAVPANQYIDVDEPITGMGTTRGFPIVFTSDKVYRIEGFIDLNGIGGLQKRVISDSVGCINHRSIVQTRDGIYYAASDGFYFTDGYKNINISEQLDITYKSLIISSTQKNRINAVYSSQERKVYFSVQVGSDNDKIFIFDELFQAWSTIDGQSTMEPTAMLYYNNSVYWGDDDGYIFLFDSTITNDPVKEVGVAVADWEEEAVVYTWKHIAFNFGDFSTNKWVNQVSIQLKDESGQHMAVSSFDNDDSTGTALKPVTSVGLLAWGESGFAWGDSGLPWRRTFAVVKTRKMPDGTRRTKRKQLQLTNQTDAILHKSDAIGNVTVDATAKTITLDNTSLSWNDKIVGYRVRLADSVGGYGTEFDIVTRNSDTVFTVTDSDGNLVDGSQAFEVIGIRKDEYLRLQSVTFTGMGFNEAGQFYKSSESQGNDR